MTPAVGDIKGARVLGLFGDKITTDHISPPGSDQGLASPAGQLYLIAGRRRRGRLQRYGASRGNHEVMMRGTFANIRIKNEMLGGKEGGATCALPDGARCRSTTRR